MPAYQGLMSSRPNADVLKPREVVAINNLLSGEMTVTESMLQAGYAPTTTAKSTSAWLKRDRVQRQIRRALAARGIDPDKIGQKLAEGLEAETTQIVAKDGMVSDTFTQPDHAARHRYLKTVLEVVGATTKQAPPPENGQTYEVRLLELRRQMTQAARTQPGEYLDMGKAAVVDPGASCAVGSQTGDSQGLALARQGNEGMTKNRADE